MGMTMERKTEQVEYKQFDVWFADLGTGKGSVQQGARPVMIISNDRGNKHSPCVIVSPVTAQMGKAKLPTHVQMKAGEIGVDRDSIVTFEQHFTLDKSELEYKLIDNIPNHYKVSLHKALQISTSMMY